MDYNYIIEGDSIDVLKYVPNEHVDIVITSPPYNVAHDYDNYDDNMEDELYFNFMKSIFKEIHRVLKKDGRVCINVPFAIKNRKSKKVSFLSSKFAMILNELGFKDFEWITWHKGRNINHFQGNNTAWGSWKSPSSPSFRPMGESVMVFYKDEKRMVREKENIDITADEFKNRTKNVWYFDEDNQQVYENVLTVPNNSSKKIHPAPYPVELIERLLKMYSYKGATVLDPFNGIGTTSIAAEKLGRNFIGIEQSKLYCDIAYESLSKDNTLRVTINDEFLNLVNPGDIEGTLNSFFPYKESFSPKLLERLTKRYDIKKARVVYDPFLGTGSSFTNHIPETIYGVDVSPFALNVSYAKLIPLNELEVKKALSFNEKIKDLKIKEFEYPGWGPYPKYAEKEKYDIVKTVLDSFEVLDQQVNHYLKYLIYSNLDSIFDYKRDGNGIKYRKSKIKVEDTINYISELIKDGLVAKLAFDKENNFKNINILEKSSVNFKLEEPVDLVLTSPPYANMFDYFEVYKMELWTSGLVSSYDEWRALKKRALRSNLSSDLDSKNRIENHILELTIDSLRDIQESEKTITMLDNYFFDMHLVLKNIYDGLLCGSYAFIVVGNSFYGGIPVPTDLILAEEARKMGYEIEDIIFARKLNSSPQQMKVIRDQDKIYLRESIIVLRKG